MHWCVEIEFVNQIDYFVTQFLLNKELVSGDLIRVQIVCGILGLAILWIIFLIPLCNFIFKILQSLSYLFSTG